MQWKLPTTLSSFVQCAGQAAQGPDKTGLAVLLVKKSAYDVDLKETMRLQEEKPSKKKTICTATDHPKSMDKNYAINHGVLVWGAYDGASDKIPADVEGGKVPLDKLSMDKGLHSLVQELTCRRSVLTAVYKNKKPSKLSISMWPPDMIKAHNLCKDPTVPCCDLCSPSLLNRTRPGPPPKNTWKKACPTPGVVDKELKKEIVRWRKEIWTRDFEDSLFGPSVILTDPTVELLSLFGRINKIAEIRIVLGYWAWFEKYREELFAVYQSLEVIAPKKPKLTKPRQGQGEKQTIPQEGGSKRQHIQESPINVAVPTPVNPCPTPRRLNRPLTTPSRLPSSYPALYSSIPSTPTSYNPYSALVTPSTRHPSSQIPLTTPHIPYSSPFSFHYPYYYPASSTPSSSHSTPARYFNPYYPPLVPPPRPAPPPPGPPPST